MASPKGLGSGNYGDPKPDTKNSKGMGFLLNACGWFFATCYGLVVYNALILRAYTGSRKFRYMNENDHHAVQLARKRLWNLQILPWSLTHKFINVRGVILHYVLHKPKNENKGSTPLVIFMHGFPG
jgi:hypothetical protein